MSFKKRIVILIVLLIPAVRIAFVKAGFDNSASRLRLNHTPSVSNTQSASLQSLNTRPDSIFTAEVMLQYGQYSFTEKDVSTEGSLTGVNGSLLFPIQGGLQVGARGQYMSGDTTYSGEYANTTGGPTVKAKGPAKDDYYDIGGIGQVDIFNESDSTAAFFTGLSYRLHNNKANMPGGYAREISALYLPIGLNGKFGLSQSWAIKLEGEFDYLISGKSTSHMSQVGPQYSDFTNDQNSGYGIRAALRAQYQIAKMSILLGPYYSYWKVEDSNSVPMRYQNTEQYMIEPQNATTQFGLNLGVQY